MTRILSTRILSPARDRATGQVAATVSLLVGDPSESPAPAEVRIAVTAPARAPGAPPLRQRLAATARLALYADMTRAGTARQAA